MQSLFALIGGAALFGVLLVNTSSESAPHQPSASTSSRTTARVMVHCSAGNREAFVTPVRIEIAVGDTVEWRAAGNVVADSIVISLKDSTQVWPFEGSPSRGGPITSTAAAVTPGTYGYNVTLVCRGAGGGMRREVIDPDIIIGE